MIVPRFLVGSLVLAISTPVLAGPRLTDSQFVQASRCHALAKATRLGVADAAAYTALVKVQRQGRSDYVVDRASDAVTFVTAQARRADGAARADLIAERDGPCQALLAR